MRAGSGASAHAPNRRVVEVHDGDTVLADQEHTLCQRRAPAPSAGSRQSVSRPRRSASVIGSSATIDRRHVDIAVRPVGHRHRRAPPQQIAWTLRARWNSDADHALGGNPEVLAGGGQHLEAAGQQIVGVAQVVERCLAVLARRTWARRLRGGRPVARPPQRRRSATPPAPRAAAAAPRSGRPGTPAPGRHGKAAGGPCRRGSVGGIRRPRARWTDRSQRRRRE